MAKSRISGQINFTVQISKQARKSFETLHSKLGLKRRGLTFEALVFSANVSEIIDHRELSAITYKLDHLIKLLETP